MAATDLAVLDVGALTIDLLRASVDTSGLHARSEFQRGVRLGAGTLLTGTISQEAWGSALSAIESLLDCVSQCPPEHWVAVGTSVIREAINGPAFRKTLACEYGLDMRILSARDEAALSYRGVVSEFDPGCERLMVVDLGGGCVNFAAGQGSNCSFVATLPIGTVRLLPAFAPHGTLTRDDAALLADLLQRSLSAVSARIEQHRPFRLIFSAGSARAVHRHALGRHHALGEPGRLTRASLARTHRQLIDTSCEDLVSSGADVEQADILAISAALMSAITQAMGVDEAGVAERGLREGVAIEAHERLQAAATAEAGAVPLSCSGPRASRVDRVMRRGGFAGRATGTGRRSMPGRRTR